MARHHRNRRVSPHSEQDSCAGIGSDVVVGLRRREDRDCGRSQAQKVPSSRRIDSHRPPRPESCSLQVKSRAAAARRGRPWRLPGKAPLTMAARGPRVRLRLRSTDAGCRRSMGSRVPAPSVPPALDRPPAGCRAGRPSAGRAGRASRDPVGPPPTHRPSTGEPRRPGGERAAGPGRRTRREPRPSRGNADTFRSWSTSDGRPSSATPPAAESSSTDSATTPWSNGSCERPSCHGIRTRRRTSGRGRATS
jgi:hypothetical protein